MLNSQIKIVNQSQHVSVTQAIKDEIIAQVSELGDRFSGPVVIRDVPNYEGRYFAISCGQLWSLVNRRGNLLAHPRRVGKNHSGNNYCVLGSLDYVHRIIAITFNVPGYSIDNNTVNHKNEIKYHNFVIFNDDLSLNAEKSNLMWMSDYDNNRYGNHDANIAKAKTKLYLGIFKHENRNEYQRRYNRLNLCRILTDGSHELSAYIVLQQSYKGVLNMHDWHRTNKYVINFKEDWLPSVIEDLRSSGYEVIELN